MTSFMALAQSNGGISAKDLWPQRGDQAYPEKYLGLSSVHLLRSKPYFQAQYGAAYLGNSLELLRSLPTGQVNLVVTSPPYALHFKKEYGNKSKKEYVE